MATPMKVDPTRLCVACSSPLERKRFSGRLEDRTRFLSRMTCGEKCMGLMFVKDTSRDGSKRRRTQRYRGPCCEACGVKKSLHAHHVDGNLNNDSPSNIQTLCASCHLIHHHRVRRAGVTVPGRMESVRP